MNIRFYNARILRTNDNHTFNITKGELWVKGNKIVYIGNGKDVSSATTGDEVLV